MTFIVILQANNNIIIAVSCLILHLIAKSFYSMKCIINQYIIIFCCKVLTSCTLKLNSFSSIKMIDKISCVISILKSMFICNTQKQVKQDSWINHLIDNNVVYIAEMNTTNKVENLWLSYCRVKTKSETSRFCNGVETNTGNHANYRWKFAFRA